MSAGPASPNPVFPACSIGPGLAASLILMLVLACSMPARADATIGKFTVSFAEGTFRANGDFVVPGAVKGVSEDGDFRADRAFGNYQTQELTLVGHVVLHRRASSAGSPGPPLTLTCNQLRIGSKPAVYTATGNVVAVQGARRLQSDYLQLNDTTHEGLLRGNVHLQQNDRSLATSLLQYNLATGALNVPVPLSGATADMDFRADRAVGNNKAGTLLLTGNVVVHRYSGGGQGESRRAPLTLWCDRLDVVKTQYTATGHVRLAQGDRTLVAPVLRLNDTTHVATLTGGVHGEQPPDRTFDAAEILYNTQTQDFKALGGVKVTFPFRRGGPSASPSPESPSPGSPSPAPHSS